ncbi:MAG: DUF5683 domain-containing protein [Flavobacteriales bacterium]|nr:DUF5683 domain-containing protein [Flavobacteriaceae bacterium]
MINRLLISSLIILISISGISQEKEIDFDELDPSAPSKAAFYSAVLPGLGQGFNKKYWKIPIVYAAIGTSIFSYDFNQKKYWDYRNAYKSRKAGYNNDPYQNLIIDDDRLLDGADFHKKNRDLSMVFIVGFYILNILDANIDSHLKQYNVNESLTLKPYLNQGNELSYKSIGLSLNLNF